VDPGRSGAGDADDPRAKALRDLRNSGHLLSPIDYGPADAMDEFAVKLMTRDASGVPRWVRASDEQRCSNEQALAERVSPYMGVELPAVTVTGCERVEWAVDDVPAC
jgi:hypothetical protein